MQKFRVSPSRRAAFDILRRVEEESSFASLLLATSTGNLRADDRALCYELVLGSLRWQLWLDKLIEHYAAPRSAESLDASVRRALRLGLYQLRFLTRVPPSAAVNESVNLAHADRKRSAAGFINAVLRRATREPHFDPAAEIEDLTSRLAVETSHPIWLLERWIEAFGRSEAEAFARANNSAPPVSFRLAASERESGTFRERLLTAGVDIVPSKIVPGGWRLEKGNSASLQELTRAGSIYLQDEASQLVSYALGGQPGERILDTCAAPGSKTTHLAALLGGGGTVVAGDIHPHRLRIVRESAERQKLKNIHTVTIDATLPLPFTESSFDRVLVDAPCSGTGTLRHNPEIRWRISTSDIAELADRQKLLLVNASRAVRPGGLLVYSTCSVEPEENESVVATFLSDNGDFKIAKPDNLTEFWPDESAFRRTWPQKEGADGFFIAVMKRTR